MIKFFKKRMSYADALKKEVVKPKQEEQKKSIEESAIEDALQKGATEDLAKILQKDAFKYFNAGDVVEKMAEKTKRVVEKTGDSNLVDVFRKQMNTLFQMELVSHDDATARVLIHEGCQEAVLNALDYFEDLGEVALDHLDKYVTDSLFAAGLDMRSYSDREWRDFDTEIEEGFSSGKTAEELMEGKDAVVQRWVHAKDMERRLQGYGVEADAGADIKSGLVSEVAKLKKQIEEGAVDSHRALKVLDDVMMLFKKEVESQ